MDFIFILLGCILALITLGAFFIVALFIKCDLVAAEEERKRHHEKQAHH